MKYFNILLAAVTCFVIGCSITNEVSLRPADIQQTSTPNSNTEVPCLNFDKSCCENAEYCGVSKADLLKYIGNYRDSVWSKTSLYFEKNPTKYDKKILFDPNCPKGELDFDARFMDVNLEQLKNYICRIENASDPVVRNTNTLRMYYIRYDELVPEADGFSPNNYSTLHSIAFVPAVVSASDGVVTGTQEFTEIIDTHSPFFVAGAPNCDPKSYYANHNNLCPPLTDCGDILKNTLIYDADMK